MVVVYLCQSNLSIHPTLLFPHLCPQVHSLRLSIPALQVGSTVPSNWNCFFLTPFAESERFVLKHELYHISVGTFLTLFLKLSEP